VHRITLDFFRFAFPYAYGDSAAGRALIAGRVVPGCDTRRIFFRGNNLWHEQLDIALHTLAVQNTASNADTSGPDKLQQISTADL
jgi:hypothetical protein